MMKKKILKENDESITQKRDQLLKTVKGIKYFIKSILIGIIITILAFIIALIAFSILNSVGYDYNKLSNIIVGSLFILTSVACASLILILLSIAFLVNGIIHFNQGKKKFSKRHSKNVIIGTIYFILWLIIAFSSFAIQFLYFDSQINSAQDNWEFMRGKIILTSLLSLIATTFLGLMYVLMIRKSAVTNDRRILWIGFILFLLSGILSVIVVIYMLPVSIEDISSNELENLRIIGETVRGFGDILLIIGYILFLLAYYHTGNSIEVANSMK